MDTIGAEVRRQARQIRSAQELQMRSQRSVAPYEGRSRDQAWLKPPDYRRGAAGQQTRMATCWRCGRDGRYRVSSASRYKRLSHQHCHYCDHPLGKGAGTRYRDGNRR